MRKICASFALIVKRKLTFRLKLRSFRRTARTELYLMTISRFPFARIQKKNNLKVPIWRIEKNLDVFSLSPPSFATLERTCATKTKEDLLKVNIITALFVWQLRLFYDEDAANLNVTVIGGEGLAPKESTTPPNPYVRIYFLPDKRYRCLGLLCFLLNKCHWLLLFFCLFFAF